MVDTVGLAGLVCWNWLALHGVHVAALSVSEMLPASHGVQLRSEMEVPFALMLVPAAHEAWSTQ